jgi:uncharacterized protein (DUF58 family)
MIDGTAADPLVDLSEIAEIELFVLRRMKERTIGDHDSVFRGPGFNFVGIRDWEPGDRTSSIDWAQSSLTNFSPLITREFGAVYSGQRSSAEAAGIAVSELKKLLAKGKG